MKTLLILTFVALGTIVSNEMLRAEEASTSELLFTPTQMVAVQKAIEGECDDMLLRQKLPKDKKKDFMKTCVKDNTDRAARFRLPPHTNAASEQPKSSAGEANIKPQH